MSLRFAIPRPRQAAFTLLEVCLALFIALLMVGIALPSLAGLVQNRKAERSFEAFDSLARQARSLALQNGRAYVLRWEKEAILLQPEEPTSTSPQEPLGELLFSQGEAMPQPTFDAALTRERAPIWTFWPNGTCEPLTVTHAGWNARYHPLTTLPEVSYE